MERISLELKTQLAFVWGWLCTPLWVGFPVMHKPDVVVTLRRWRQEHGEFEASPGLEPCLQTVKYKRH